jgi:Trp operon repressor
MPHVSKIKIDPKFSEKLFKKLISILGKAQAKNYLPIVISELFTKTEKIMLAKRLAIILLLSDNIPQHKITDVLKVSPTTVAKISLQIKIGKHKTILAISKKEKIDLEKIVWDILTLGGMMPPIARIGGKYWLKNKN